MLLKSSCPVCSWNFANFSNNQLFNFGEIFKKIKLLCHYARTVIHTFKYVTQRCPDQRLAWLSAVQISAQLDSALSGKALGLAWLGAVWNNLQLCWVEENVNISQFFCLNPNISASSQKCNFIWLYCTLYYTVYIRGSLKNKLFKQFKLESIWHLYFLVKRKLQF